VFVAERLPDDRDWALVLDGRKLHEEPSPIVDLVSEGGWESYLSARSSNFRQQVRRRGRRLTGSLGVNFRLADDPARLGADFDALMALHAARWGSASAAVAGQRAAFHREFAAVALERGWLRLWLAEAEGQPIAAWYGFRFAGVESYYQSGRDPSWDKFAIGAGVLEHTLREAFADGMREYRLLRGGEEYKRRYATSWGTVDTVATARGGVGRAVIAAAATAATRPRGRRLLKLIGD
jgi:CelD/BcsL family acetyltransferase involved in cellulose biosynthesis